MDLCFTFRKAKLIKFINTEQALPFAKFRNAVITNKLFQRSFLEFFNVQFMINNIMT